eukprot:TRINITY_DN3347_c0_g1_i1.p1 TRINITY_DN3347_c0_g1~~TRINITY_DN3347_c0_g1_i1.p1  ORF type:complete len:372 (-),score=81.23 TRINITY_DN3347_c0_g1_i1:96-1166(-)
MSQVKIDDRRVVELRPLIPPAILIEELPLTDKIIEVVQGARTAAENVVNKSDDRLIVVVGPCSIHDTKAALEYAGLVKQAIEEYKDDLLIIMRVYFEKPRTTVGWKGLLNDPYLNGSYQINQGLRIGRGVLRDINALGVPCGVEFLDTISPQYLADLVSWGAIGARTTESQIHRELSSGLSMPIGFKNSTSGDYLVAVESIKAASAPHSFLGVGKYGLSAIVRTTGNDTCHLILRGGRDSPNYDANHVKKSEEIFANMKIDARIMIDCSHGNSCKVHTNQPVVVNDIVTQVSAGNKNIIGLMIESNLVEGTQKIPDEGPQYLRYGQSITDACLSWKQTLPLFKSLAEAVRARRAHK